MTSELPGTPADAADGAQLPDGEAPPARIGTLRGPAVQVDARRAARVVVVAVLVGLCVLTVALFVAAVNKDSAIVRLQQHGVPVEVTVTSCLGNLGGSGSNAASYTCSGTFSLDGHHQTDVIDGTTTFHRSGSTIAAVTDPSDPADLATATTVATTHRSGSAYVVPIILAVVLVLLIALVVWRRPRPDDDRTAGGTESGSGQGG
jgi:predicted histidine transporter YuiF (NhaC family)